MDPLLLDVPELLETERLVLRAPRFGEAAEINLAVHESFLELHQWMTWARHLPTMDESETFSRKCAAAFMLRQELNYRIYLKQDELFAGCITLFNIDWSIPRIEIGYWLRSRLRGAGYMTEAVSGLTALSMDSLKANRVEIRSDVNNLRSRRIAERLGFTLEGILRHHDRAPSGELRNTCLFAMTAEDWKAGKVVKKTPVY
jgi:RimJ/RimL family protein N-acetyltransferase